MAVNVTNSTTIAEYTDTTGTGDYSLRGALSGCFRFRDLHVDGDSDITYIVSDGPNIEVVIGTLTYSDPDTLSRDTILSSSNNDDAISWAGNTRPLVRESSTSGRLWAPSVSLAGPLVGGRLPGAGESLFNIGLAYSASLPIGLEGSVGGCNVTSTNTANFTLKKNGVSIGTATFAAGASTPTFGFVSSVDFVPDNVFTLFAPNPQDATLADFWFTFKGTLLS